MSEVKKKEISKKQKLIKIKKLFDKMLEILPENSLGLTIHDITRKEIPREVYELKCELSGDILVYMNKNRKRRSFGIDIFCKEN